MHLCCFSSQQGPFSSIKPHRQYPWTQETPCCSPQTLLLKAAYPGNTDWVQQCEGLTSRAGGIAEQDWDRMLFIICYFFPSFNAVFPFATSHTHTPCHLIWKLLLVSKATPPKIWVMRGTGGSTINSTFRSLVTAQITSVQGLRGLKSRHEIHTYRTMAVNATVTWPIKKGN